MTKKISSLLLIAALFGGCLKDNSGDIPAVDCSTIKVVAPSSEVSQLKTYLDTNHITAVQDSRGFFYSMDSTAVPDSVVNRVSVCSNITVTYRGYFQNGKGFDSSNAAISFPLATTITGWKEAIPLMKKNAVMTLYLPSSLAYGAAGSNDYPQTIPPNTPLNFTIKLYNY